MYREALSEIEKAVALSRGAAMPLANLGYVRARLGQREEARRILRQLADAVEGAIHAGSGLRNRSCRSW